MKAKEMRQKIIAKKEMRQYLTTIKYFLERLHVHWWMSIENIFSHFKSSLPHFLLWGKSICVIVSHSMHSIYDRILISASFVVVATFGQRGYGQWSSSCITRSRDLDEEMATIVRSSVSASLSTNQLQISILSAIVKVIGTSCIDSHILYCSIRMIRCQITSFGKQIRNSYHFSPITHNDRLSI